jgi:phosphoenolpyruvate carboxylase
MNNSTKFTVTVDKLNKLITELNIKISKDPNNTEMKEKLENLISDKNKLYKGTLEDLENIIAKYGDCNND